MRILERTITLPSLDTELRIIPFGCVHADTEGFAASLWKECVEDIMQPHTYAIGAGDYLDAVRTHARVALDEYRAKGEDDGTPDKWALREYQAFYDTSLQRIREKILFIGKGNHLWNFTTGETSDQMLARLCQCPYGDKPTFLRLSVQVHGKIIKTFKILVHHEGGGGGGYARHGTDVNAAETKLYQFGAFDIVVFSHTHRKWGLTIPDLDLPDRGALRLVERTRALIRTGCFTQTARSNGKSPKQARNVAHNPVSYRMKLEF